MIQLSRGKLSASSYSNNFYLNLYDAYINKSNIQYRPIIALTNQQTGNLVNLKPRSDSYVTTYKERYVKMEILIRTSELLNSGIVNLGTKDRPYGFYDVTIYEYDSNLSIPGQGVIDEMNIVYKGLANLTDSKFGGSFNPAVEYKEYTDNDSDTDSVYITNTYT